MRRDRTGEKILVGIGLLCALHTAFTTGLLLFLYLLAFVPIGWNWIPQGMAFALFGIGFTQVLYALPMGIWLYRRRQLEVLKGLCIAAALTLLICGTCFIQIWGAELAGLIGGG